jgi:hypothetical protein
MFELEGTDAIAIGHCHHSTIGILSIDKRLDGIRVFQIQLKGGSVEKGQRGRDRTQLV